MPFYDRHADYFLPDSKFVNCEFFLFIKQMFSKSTEETKALRTLGK